MGNCQVTGTVTLDIPDDDISTQTISLPIGWSIFSTYIVPDSKKLQDIFQDIDSNIIIVKDRNGAVYWPNLNSQGDYLNTIGDIKQGNGYIVNTNLSIDL